MRWRERTALLLWWLAPLLWVTPATFAHETPASVGGDFTYTPAGESPTQIHYQYGPAPEIDEGSFEAFKSLNDNLRILDQTLDERFDVVVLREEGELTELPAQITEGVRNVTVLEVPKKVVQGLKRFYKTVYQKPSWSTGFFFGTTKTGLSASVYFSTLPVESAMIMSLTTFSITTITGAYNGTIENVLSYGAPSTPATGWKSMLKPKYFVRNLIYNVFLAHLYNEAGLHRNTHEQTTINALTTSPTGLFFSVQRQLLLAGKRHLTAAYSLLVSPIFWVLSALEQTGSVSAITEIAGYQLRPTVIASLTIYTALIIANAKVGNQIIKFLEKVDRRIDQIRDLSLGVIKKITFGYCNRLLGGDSRAKTLSRRLGKGSSRPTIDSAPL